MKKTIVFILLSVLCLNVYSIETFIQKEYNIDIQVGETVTLYPTSKVGLDKYNPTNFSFSVQTATGFLNPGVTNNIVKVSSGYTIGENISRNLIKIKAIGVGKCRIVCSCSFKIPLQQTMGLASIIYHVNVKEPIIKVSSIYFNKNKLQLFIGKSEQLLCSIYPNNASNQTLNWASSDNNIATVSSQGVITGIGNGTAQISATSTDGSGVYSICNVRIIIPIKNIILNNTYLFLKVGEESRITATILPLDASIKQIQWLSSDPTIASVDTDGNIRCLRKGTCKIIASSTDGTDIYTECIVNVEERKPVQLIELDKTNTILQEGQSEQLTATVLPEDADNKNVVWHSDNEDVVKVDENGLVHALCKGKANVIALSAGNSAVPAVCRIIVTKAVESITLNKDEIVLQEGQSEQLTATVLPEDANNKNVVWHSDNEDVVKVDESGLVSAISLGETTIKVFSSSNTSIYAKCKIRVTQCTYIFMDTIDKIKVSIKDKHICITNLPNEITLSVFNSEGVEEFRSIPSNHKIDYIPKKSGIYIIKFGCNSTKILIK